MKKKKVVPILSTHNKIQNAVFGYGVPWDSILECAAFVHYGALHVYLSTFPQINGDY